MALEQQMHELAERLKGLPSGSAFEDYITWLNESLEKKDILFADHYQKIVEAEEPYRGEGAPFLSIITRTQGKRPEMLGEMLLSLCGQSDMDFEVVLVGHKLDEDQLYSVERIISEQPPEMKERIRFIRVDHGTRTTPLNTGFAHARGNYIAVMDDDDIALDNWVEEYHKASKRRPGAVLHAYVLTQSWLALDNDSDGKFLRADSGFGSIYCEPFDLLRQTRDNLCPLNGIAYPSFYFQKLGMIYNEALTTTEDWEYMMRVVFFAGVEDIKVPTTIWRQWKNAENSLTVHSKDEWKKNYNYICKEITDIPILVPKGSRKSISSESLLAASENDLWMYRIPRLQFSTLYLNKGEGFNQNTTLITKPLAAADRFDAEFVLSDQDSEDLCEIRFDVCEEGMFVMEDVIADVTYRDGSSELLTIARCRCNGARYGDSICFLKGDPWLVWPVRTDKKTASVRITGKMHVNMSQGLIRYACCDIGGCDFQLYYAGKGEDFKEEKSLVRHVPVGGFDCVFNIGDKEEIASLRLDPGEDKGCALSDCVIELITESGSSELRKISDIDTNGVAFGERIAFVNDDPQIIISSVLGSVKTVRIKGTLSVLSPENVQNLGSNAGGIKSILRKARKRLGR